MTLLILLDNDWVKPTNTDIVLSDDEIEQSTSSVSTIDTVASEDSSIDQVASEDSLIDTVASDDSTIFRDDTPGDEARS